MSFVYTPPTRVDIDLVRGFQLANKLVITFYEDEVHTIPLNLTTYTWDASMKNTASGLVTSISALFLAENLSIGQIKFDPSTAQTTAMAAGEYTWDLSLTTNEPRALPPLVGGSIDVRERN